MPQTSPQSNATEREAQQVEDYYARLIPLLQKFNEHEEWYGDILTQIGSLTTEIESLRKQQPVGNVEAHNTRIRELLNKRLELCQEAYKKCYELYQRVLQHESPAKSVDEVQHHLATEAKHAERVLKKRALSLDEFNSLGLVPAEGEDIDIQAFYQHWNERLQGKIILYGSAGRYSIQSFAKEGLQLYSIRMHSSVINPSRKDSEPPLCYTIPLSELSAVLSHTENMEQIERSRAKGHAGMNRLVRRLESFSKYPERRIRLKPGNLLALHDYLLSTRKPDTIAYLLVNNVVIVVSHHTMEYQFVILGYNYQAKQYQIRVGELNNPQVQHRSVLLDNNLADTLTRLADSILRWQYLRRLAELLGTYKPYRLSSLTEVREQAGNDPKLSANNIIDYIRRSGFKDERELKLLEPVLQLVIDDARKGKQHEPRTIGSDGAELPAFVPRYVTDPHIVKRPGFDDEQARELMPRTMRVESTAEKKPTPERAHAEVR